MKPVNNNATKEAKELLQYLYDTAGNKIITGQHTQTVPMEERTHIHSLTGKYPKLQGFELLAYSPNINYADASEECLTEVEENKHTVETAIQWAKTTNGIVSLCFHWFSPIGGEDKSFYSIHTDFDPSQILVEGTKERKAFYHDLDVIAAELQRFQAESIPVLWRPLHEAEGTWFWWGSKGPDIARELYKLVFDYYVHKKHLDNLLWVWSCPTKDGYPGDAYVDVIGWDIYLEPHTATDYKKEYEELIANTTGNKVAALTEVGVIPDVGILKHSKIPWAYYMTWSKEFCLTEEHNYNDSLQKMYTSDYAIAMN
ncbi:MAG: glycoside hydrolase family 26 protein [Lachnospiraceae bacterium]|nr:glycoside hydrolase family 26 protein [Lachnospiraceae bacterium]